MSRAGSWVAALGGPVDPYDHDATGAPDASLERSEQRIADDARWERARAAWAAKHAARRAAMADRDLALESAAQEWAAHQIDADLVGWSLRMHLAELRWAHRDLPDPRDADEALRWVGILEAALESERESRETADSMYEGRICRRPGDCYCRECEPTHVGNTYRDGQCWVCGARQGISHTLRAVSRGESLEQARMLQAGDACQRCQSRALVAGLAASVKEEK